MDPVTATIILGAGLNYINSKNQQTAQVKQNALDRQFSLDMYNRQRSDALSDWTMQNKYNAPEQQMQRYKEAGLNPNLIYGNMANSPVVRSTDFKDMSQIAPKMDLAPIADTISQYQDVAMKKQQTDMMKVQADLANKEAMLKTAQTGKVLQDTATSEFELNKAKQLKDSAIDYANIRNESMKQNMRIQTIETRIKQDANARAKMANSANVAKTLQEIVNFKKSADMTDTLRLSKQQEMEINKLDLELSKKGIRRNDTAWWRAMRELLSVNSENGGFFGGSDNLY